MVVYKTFGEDPNKCLVFQSRNNKIDTMQILWYCVVYYVCIMITQYRVIIIIIIYIKFYVHYHSIMWYQNAK